MAAPAVAVAAGAPVDGCRAGVSRGEMRALRDAGFPPSVAEPREEQTP
jgi:hypothetical protein